MNGKPHKNSNTEHIVARKANRLPREVWLAAISLKELWPVRSVEKRMKDVLGRMESVYAFEPDIICLPEMVNVSWVTIPKVLEEIAEDEVIHGPITSMIAKVAREQQCYVVCPIITKKDGRFYNSSILLNRQGKTAGIFHKIHTLISEITPDDHFKGKGITPGSDQPEVYRTDFGTIGMQICADAEWTDGWRSLKKDGAEIVCFSSQDPHAAHLSNRAWVNNYYILSATGGDARIVDITGDTIASDGQFARWVCAPVNLEKEFIYLWPHVNKFRRIQRQYKRKVRFRIYHPENWAVIESNDASVKVADILKEFDIPTFREQIAEAEMIQNKMRR